MDLLPYDAVGVSVLITGIRLPAFSFSGSESTLLGSMDMEQVVDLTIVIRG